METLCLRNLWWELYWQRNKIEAEKITQIVVIKMDLIYFYILIGGFYNVNFVGLV